MYPEPLHTLRRGRGVRRIGLSLALVLALLSTGCDPEGGSSTDADGRDEGLSDTTEAQPFVLDLGLLGAGAHFESMASESRVELIVGFQGLIFIDLALLAEGEGPRVFSAEAKVSFEQRPDFDFSFRNNRVEFDPHGPSRLCPSFLVPFGQDLALIEGQPIVLELTLTAPGWRGEATRRMTIVDEEACYEGPSGELLCE